MSPIDDGRVEGSTSLGLEHYLARGGAAAMNSSAMFSGQEFNLCSLLLSSWEFSAIFQTPQGARSPCTSSTRPVKQAQCDLALSTPR